MKLVLNGSAAATSWFNIDAVKLIGLVSSKSSIVTHYRVYTVLIKSKFTSWKMRITLFLYYAINFFFGQCMLVTWHCDE